METELASKEVLDFDELLVRVGGQRELADELFKIFQEEAPVLIQEIVIGFADQDAEAVHHSAHSLKGLIFNFGKIESGLELTQVERFAIAGDLEMSATHFERFKPMHLRLWSAIEIATQPK